MGGFPGGFGRVGHLHQGGTVMNCCDHDCNEGRDCPARARKCDELGVCMQRTPPCTGCAPAPFRLAPDVLQGYRVPLLGTPAQRRELKRWLLPAMAFSAAVTLAGLAVGVIAGRFFP